MSQAEQRALALQWASAKETLDVAKKAEAELRPQLVSACFPDGCSFGTQRADLGEGHTLKVEVSKSPKLDATAIVAALQLMREDGDLGGELAERVIRYKPELVVREYEKLPERFSHLFEGAVTIGQAAPAVALERPEVLRLARAH